MAFSSWDREKLLWKGMRSRLFSYKESNITSHKSHLRRLLTNKKRLSKTKRWENNQHFASSPLVSPRNDVWGTSTEIPYWWRVTTQIWMLIPATCTNIRKTFLFCSKLWLVTDLKAASFLTLRYACPFQVHTWPVNLLLMSYWTLGMWDIPILDTCHQLSLRVWEQFQVHLKTTGEINIIKDLRRQLIKGLIK